MNKIISLTVIICFLISFVISPVVAGAAAINQSAAQYNQIFNNFVLPYSFGQITSAHYSGTDRVLINIQDLHSHPKVQKNISNIIELFDKKYGVNKVFLEGAYGQVSTKWIEEKTNKRNKNKILEMMLETGRLTGAEYYSAKSDKTEIIEGLEKKEPYLDNLKRFGQLLEEQEKIEEILKAIEDSTKELKERYYGKRQKKIEKLSQDYKDNKITSKKYYTLLAKHIDKLGIDINKYENTLAYIMLLDLQKGLNYTKITRELQNLVYVLKGQLPYNAYKKLLEHTDNFTRTDSLYAYIIQIARMYNLDLSVNFSNLDKYFRYIELSQKINPIELIAEEDRLRHEVNTRFSETKAQRDVVFLIDFNKYLRDYITTKITSGDYQYYKENIEEYRETYNKYVDNRVLSLLDVYIKEVDNFYEINSDRNIYFADNLFGRSEGLKVGSSDSDPQSMLNKTPFSPVIASETTSSVAIQRRSAVSNPPILQSSNLPSSSDVNKIIENMKDVKTVDVVITGGFHSQTVTEILKEQGVSYIVITPNVTDGVKLAEETYHNIVKEQSRISFQTLASLISSLSIIDQIKILKMAGIKDEELKGIYSPQQLEQANREGQKASPMLETVTPKVMELAGILESDEMGDIKERTLQILKDRVGEKQKEIVDEELLNKIETEKLKDLLEDEDITKLQKVITTVSKDSAVKQAADIIRDMAETVQKYSITAQTAEIATEVQKEIADVAGDVFSEEGELKKQKESYEDSSVELQTEKTQGRLMVEGRNREYTDPENFRFDLKGMKLGVWHEMLPFWKIFSIPETIFGKKIDSFVKEHENPTALQKIAIWVIRALSIGAGIFAGKAVFTALIVSVIPIVFTPFIITFAGVTAVAVTEFVTHLAWNYFSSGFILSRQLSDIEEQLRDLNDGKIYEISEVSQQDISDQDYEKIIAAFNQAKQNLQSKLSNSPEAKNFMDSITEERLKEEISRINRYGNIFRRLQTLSRRIDAYTRSARDRFGLKEQMSEIVESVLFESLADLYEDETTKNHTKKMAKYLLQLIANAGIYLSVEDRYNFIISILMHDIGKNLIPDSILNKPDRLSSDEINIMKSHTWIGASILLASVMHNFAWSSESHHKINGYTAQSETGNDIFKSTQVNGLFDKMSALLDIYEAVATNERPYQVQYFIGDLKMILDSNIPAVMDIKSTRKGREMIENIKKISEELDIPYMDNKSRIIKTRENIELLGADENEMEKLRILQEENAEIVTAMQLFKKIIMGKFSAEDEKILSQIKNERYKQILQQIKNKTDEDILSQIRKEKLARNRESAFSVIFNFGLTIKDVLNEFNVDSREDLVKLYQTNPGTIVNRCMEIADMSKPKFEENLLRAFLHFYFRGVDIDVNEYMKEDADAQDRKETVPVAGKIDDFFKETVKFYAETIKSVLGNIQGFSVKIITGMDKDTAFVDGKQESLIILESESDAEIDGLRQQGIRAVGTDVDHTSLTGGVVIGTYPGTDVAVRVKWADASKTKIKFYVKSDIKISKDELIKMLSDANADGNRNKFFDGISEIVYVRKATKEETIKTIKNRRTAGITLPGKDFKQDLSGRKDVNKGTLAGICFRESSSTDSNIFIITPAQAEMCSAEIADLQKQGYRFIINYDKSSAFSEVMFDGAKINAEDINSVEKAKEFLKKIRELKLEKGIDTQVSVRFSKDIYSKLNMDIFSEYGILPISDMKTAQYISGKKEIEDSINDKKFEEMLRDDTVVSIVIDEDSKEFISKNKDRIKQTKSALSKYKKGSHAAQSSKFDYTVTDIVALKDILSMDVTKLTAEDLKNKLNAQLENKGIFSVDARNYIEYLQLHDRYEELLGFIRGTVFNSAAKRITKLEVISINNENFLKDKEKDSIQAILIMTVQHLVNGENLEELFTSKEESELTAQQVFEQLRSKFGNMDKVLRDNETRIDTSRSALTPFDGIPELLMDSYRPESDINKGIEVSTEAVKSMLSAA